MLNPCTAAPTVRSSTPTQVHGPAQARLMGFSAGRGAAALPSSAGRVEVVAKQAFGTLSVRAFSAVSGLKALHGRDTDGGATAWVLAKLYRVG